MNYENMPLNNEQLKALENLDVDFDVFNGKLLMQICQHDNRNQNDNPYKDKFKQFNLNNQNEKI